MRQNPERPRRQLRDAAKFAKIKSKQDAWNKEARFHDYIYREVRIHGAFLAVIVLALLSLLVRTGGAVVGIFRFIPFVPPILAFHSRIGDELAIRTAYWAVMMRRRLRGEIQRPAEPMKSEEHRKETSVARDA